MQAEQVLRATLDALSRGDAEAASAHFAPLGRLELPLLGQTLQGRAHIGAGLSHLLASSVTAPRFSLDRCHATGRIALAEGVLVAERARGESVRCSVALALEMSAEGIARLSVYLDTHGRRLWSDRLITAVSA